MSARSENRGRLLGRTALAVVMTAALAGCATPYPTRYVRADVGGVAKAGLSDHCKSAIKAPADRAEVVDCLEERAGAWEVRAANIRRIGRGAGMLAIPAAAVSMALAAQGDPNSAVLPIGLAVGSVVTYAGAYARPEQAEIGERAVAAYNCLLTAAAEWAAGDNLPVITDLYGDLQDSAATLRRGLDAVATPATLKADAEADVASVTAMAGKAPKSAASLNSVAEKIREEGERAAREAGRLTKVRDSLDAAEAVAATNYRTVVNAQGMGGVRLLQRSDDIDRVAIGELAKRELTPLAVASNARSGIQSVISAIQPATGSQPELTADKGDQPEGLTKRAPADPCIGPSGSLATACNLLQVWRTRADSIATAASAAEAELVRVKTVAAQFDTAVKANKAVDPNLGQTCVVAVTAIPVLTATPASVTLSGGKGSFRLTGGVGFYTFDAPPEGITVVPSSGVERSVRMDITGSDTLPAGKKWDLVFYDGAATPSSVVVQVETPAQTPAPAGN